MPTSVVEVELAASPLDVFDLFATSDGLARWLPLGAGGEIAVGGFFELAVGTARFCFRVDVLEPPRMIVWTSVDGVREWRGSTLRLEVSFGDGVTLVRLTHSGWRWREAGGLLTSCGFSWTRQMVRLRDVVGAAQAQLGRKRSAHTVLVVSAGEPGTCCGKSCGDPGARR